MLILRGDFLSKIIDRVHQIAQPIAEEVNLRIYEVEYKKEGSDWFLRVFLYGEQGVTIDDCEHVSRKLSDELDKEDLISTAYYLEVSSPGINRVLTQGWHYETAVGQEIEVKLFAAVNGSKTLCGILTEYNEEYILLSTEKEQIKIENKKIAGAKLCILK